MPRNPPTALNNLTIKILWNLPKNQFTLSDLISQAPFSLSEKIDVILYFSEANAYRTLASPPNFIHLKCIKLSIILLKTFQITFFS